MVKILLHRIDPDQIISLMSQITHVLFYISFEGADHVAHIKTTQYGEHVLHFHDYEYIKHSLVYFKNKWFYWRCRLYKGGCPALVGTHLANGILMTNKTNNEINHTCNQMERMSHGHSK